MVPDPLHPAVVHFPMALAALIPAFALIAILAIRQGLLPPRTWVAIVLFHVLLVGSAWLAVETGEDQEERVERVVAERYIEDHEEAAERFLGIAVFGLFVASAGLLSGRAGGISRGAALLVSLAMLAAGLAVGHSGGELVYTHGAANVYVTKSSSPAEGLSASSVRPLHRGEDDDHE